MTDRTENNRVFDDFKILTIVTLSVIVNYAFVIGISIPLVFEDIWDLEQSARCFKTNENSFTWILILCTIYYSVVTSSGICADLALHRYVSHEYVISVIKEIGDEEPYYSTKISIFSFIWAGLAALHKASTI